jgi:hypothetical protein
MRLVVWINAFIPGKVPDYTRVIPRGPYSGKTAVPLPRTARLHPANLPKDLDTGYLTDQRGFSNAPVASCRMQSYAEISAPPHPVAIIRSGHRTSGTTAVDMETGEELGAADAVVDRCKFSRLVKKPPQRPRSNFRTLPHVAPFGKTSSVPTYHLFVDGQASDPLVHAAADINYKGEFEIAFYPELGKGYVEFKGLLDEFPAFECYAQLGGRTKTLFTSPPPKGNTVVDLLGEANRKVSGMVTFP